MFAIWILNCKINYHVSMKCSICVFNRYYHLPCPLSTITPNIKFQFSRSYIEETISSWIYFLVFIFYTFDVVELNRKETSIFSLLSAKYLKKCRENVFSCILFNYDTTNGIEDAQFLFSILPEENDKQIFVFLLKREDEREISSCYGVLIFFYYIVISYR